MNELDICVDICVNRDDQTGHIYEFNVKSYVLHTVLYIFIPGIFCKLIISTVLDLSLFISIFDMEKKVPFSTNINPI